nr:hypothetical protein [Tanacetum cinerariifolium]
METRTSTELKKILEIMEADKRDVAQQMKAMQDHIQALFLSNNQRMNGDSSSSSDLVNKEGNGGRHSSGIKVDIPEYDGKLDPDEFVEWLRTVELVFDYEQTTEDNKVKIVALKLRKYASTWWSNVCLKRERRGNEKIRTWLKMKEKMKQKFLPSYYIQASFSQLHSLRQGAGGLKSRVAHVVELHTYHTLVELTLLAHKVDSQQRTKGKQEFTRPDFKSNSYQKLTTTTKPVTHLTPKSPVIHTINTDSSKAPGRCFRCQGLGHIASECPNKRIITFADFELTCRYKFGNEATKERQIDIDTDEEVVGPDEGECLVIRRALNATPTREETLQRESLFHTRCTITQRVCTLIIDGGSCTNVASQTLVDKLNLHTEPYPSPYVIQWLNQKKGIRVSHRVLLSLSIGRSYTDKIWSDVFSMDACHVLLGGPWQFDHRVMHDGYRNTYSFIHNNKKLDLTLISPSRQSNKSLPLSTLLKADQHEYHSITEFILAGLGEEDNKTPANQHPLIQPLLQSYT